MQRLTCFGFAALTLMLTSAPISFAQNLGISVAVEDVLDGANLNAEGLAEILPSTVNELVEANEGGSNAQRVAALRADRLRRAARLNRARQLRRIRKSRARTVNPGFALAPNLDYLERRFGFVTGPALGR